MKIFILSVAIVLGMTLLSHAQDGLSGLSPGLSTGLSAGFMQPMQPMQPSLNWGAGLNSHKPGVKMHYYKGQYQGYSVKPRGSRISVFTPAGKESEPWIVCTHTSSTVVCY